MVAHCKLVQHDDVRFWNYFIRGHLCLTLSLFSCVPSCTHGVQYQSRLQYGAALLQVEVDLLDANLHIVAYEQNRRRRCRQQRLWCRAWLSPERGLQFGFYDQLMMELWREDQRSFMNMRLPTEMFDEILDRVGPRIAKQHTFWRAPLDQSMKLAINLRHLASRTKYLTLFLLICEVTKLLGFLEMVDF